MPINQKFLAARAQEQRNRAIAHLPVALPFRLPLRSGRCLVVDQAHFTERMRLELILAGNWLVSSAPWRAGAGDVFQVLWRRHPLFLRPSTGEMPNYRGPITAGVRLRSRYTRFVLRVFVRFAPMPAAAEALHALLDDTAQDLPSTDADAAPAPAAPPVNHWDDLVDYFARTYGIPVERVLDLPRALLWQIHRNRLLSQPDGEIDVIDKSDALLGEPEPAFRA